MSKHAAPEHAKLTPPRIHPREYAEDNTIQNKGRYSVYQYNAHRTDLKYERIADLFMLSTAKDMLGVLNVGRDAVDPDLFQVWDNTHGVRIDTHPSFGKGVSGE